MEKSISLQRWFIVQTRPKTFSFSILSVSIFVPVHFPMTLTLIFESEQFRKRQVQETYSSLHLYPLLNDK